MWLQTALALYQIPQKTIRGGLRFGPTMKAADPWMKALPWNASKSKRVAQPITMAARRESSSQGRLRLADAGGVSLRKQDALDLSSGKQQADKKAFVESAATLLRSYGRFEDLLQGRLLHDLLCRYGLESSMFLSNCLIDMYGNVGCFAEAQWIFDAMLERNRYSFNIMLKVFSRHGMSHAAHALFNNIPFPDSYSWTTLINAYGQSGSVEDAIHLFQKMPHKNVVSWTAIIAVFSQNGHGKKALDLFCQMQIQGVSANNLTFTCTLDACAITKTLEEGQIIHAIILMESCIIDMALVTSLINMYGKCRKIPDARKCFTSYPYDSVAPWTAMISALDQHDYSLEALHLLFTMQLKDIKPDKITFVCALEACTSMESLEAAQLVHCSIVEAGFDEELYIENALVVGYGYLGRMDEARLVFSRSLQRDVVSWTAMLGAFVQSGQGKEALLLFAQMLLEGGELDKVALLCAVDACASLQSLEKGLEIHLVILNSGHGQDLEVGNALVNMYGKCGSLQYASLVFFELPRRDIFSWNTLIAAFVQSGGEEQALGLFHQMDSEGCKADNITFNSILTACSHGGLIDLGKCLYCFMMIDGGIPYDMDCLVCMVDLLSRGGLLDEAEYIVCNVGFEKSALAWLCLLGACKVHGDVGRGRKAAYHCMEQDPNNPAIYVLLSNIFNSLGE
ncbi:hypothetical protein GOP47_0025289 [Adiantum capillus-veneris]|uniref:Pentatricopeptide repeat-containing protein n=1 Tax=Adiantum capillus-veneris TaxID=13818 RepID=A0A9D4U0E9_ADICA|nr:hypothetical protein GOP47_0025289 [Adiantum capillus-veneris]